MDAFEGQRALEEVASRWALHDGTVRSLSAHATEDGVVVEVLCIPRPDSPAAELRLRFNGVTRLELVWSSEGGHEFYFVDRYKALIQASGELYLSLDPYDERDSAVDSRDGGVITARGVEAEFVMKPARDAKPRQKRG